MTRQDNTVLCDHCRHYLSPQAPPNRQRHFCNIDCLQKWRHAGNVLFTDTVWIKPKPQLDKMTNPSCSTRSRHQ